MKKTFKLTSLIMVLVLASALLVACGGKDSSSGGDGGGDSVAGNKETWGNITVLVPDNMTLKGGDILDENNPDVVNISDKENSLNYFLITIMDDEEGITAGIDATREGNEGAADVTVDAGAKWSGVSYDFSGTPVFHIYGKVGERFAVVQSYGFEPDGDITKAVLSSLEVKAAAE